MGRRRGMVRWIPLLALLLGVGLMGAYRETRSGVEVLWAASFEAALKEAKETGKPLLLNFHTAGCGWCSKEDAETFTDSNVVEASRRFVCVRLDGEMDAPLLKRYGVTAFPSTVFADAKGNIIVKTEGYIPPDRFATALRGLADIPAHH